MRRPGVQIPSRPPDFKGPTLFLETGCCSFCQLTSALGNPSDCSSILWLGSASLPTRISACLSRSNPTIDIAKRSITFHKKLPEVWTVQPTAFAFANRRFILQGPRCPIFPVRLESARAISVLDNPLIRGSYPRGTLCAAVGLIIIAAYYVRAWGDLRGKSESSVSPDTAVSFGGQPLPELRYLKWGTTASVLFFIVAGAADAGNDWLDRLVGCLMGLVAALAVGIFGVGFVALANLWKELVLQLKNAKVGSLVLSIPLAAIWLALGLGVFPLLGMFVDRLSNAWVFLTRSLAWSLIALVFYALWKGRSYAALTLRLILMVSFSAIIAAAVAFGFWWISSQTTPLLVIFLFAIGFLDGEITIRTNASGGRPSATAAHPSKWRGVFDRRFLTCFLSSFPIRPTSLLLFTTF
jgi:hypothetical protein